MRQFISSITIIILGLATGYLLQTLIKHHKLSDPLDNKVIAKRLQQMGLLVLNPIALIGALWIVNFNSIRLIALPFLGVIAIILGASIALKCAKWKGLSREQQGAYLVLGGSANMGTIGGIVTYIYLGEIGFALVPLYKLFEELAYYGILFPISKTFGSQRGDKEKISDKLKRLLYDPFIIVSVGSVLLGIILNVSGIKRSAYYGQLNSIIIPLSSFVLLVSIGINMKWSNLKNHIKPGLYLIAIKSLIIPLVIIIVGSVVGLGKVGDGIPLKVAYILASMPPGFVSLVPPLIYDLDLEFANVCWLLTYCALIVVIPFIGIILKFI